MGDAGGSILDMPMDPADFVRPIADLARELIGALLVVGDAGGVIVETEAYDRFDPASHSWSGPTARNAAMFGPPGHAYVYRSYGIHWCLNLVGGPAPEQGGAVLVRALDPTCGLARMAERRGSSRRTSPERRERLCAGPGRLTQALGITGAHDGCALAAPPFRLEARANVPRILVGPRIGISKAVTVPWRFGLEGSPALSRPFRVAPPPHQT